MGGAWRSDFVGVSDNMEATFSIANLEKDFVLETDDQDLKCSICNYKATTKHELKYHEDEEHNWCWVCEKNFETKREFKTHHYTVHSSSRSIWD